MAPNYQFQDRSGKQLLPAAEYVVVVTGVEFGISKGAKTNGCETMTLIMQDEVNGVELRDTFIFHPSTEWKVDVMLKAIGKAPAKGQQVEFTENLLIGSRAWVAVSVEEYDRKDGSGKGKTNRIGQWINNKPLPAEEAF